MFPFALSGLRSGLRGRSFHAVFALGLVLIGIAFLSGYFSPRQPRTVALDVGFSGLRFSLVLLNLFWIQEMVAKEIDRRTIVFSLSYPVSRADFLIGRFLAIIALSVLAAIMMALLLWIAVFAAGGSYTQNTPVNLGFPYWATVSGLVLDAAVVAAFALLIATLSTVSILPLALGAAFAIAGKGLGATMEYLARGADGDKEFAERFNPLVELIRWVLPDLSRFDWRDWPMYSVSPSGEGIAWSLVLGAGYISLMLFLAIVSFSRREFS